MSDRSERTVAIDQVRQEHLAEVDEGHHWAYLVGVIVFGTLLMLALIAWLGAMGA